jgi:transcriptional regulator with XRE-family HTH domain
LEEKRESLRLTKAQFGERLGLGSQRAAEAFYEQVLHGRRGILKAKIPAAADILGLETTELSVLMASYRKSLLHGPLLTGDQLRYLAGIADAAKGPLPFSLLLTHLRYMPEK